MRETTFTFTFQLHSTEYLSGLFVDFAMSSMELQAWVYKPGINSSWRNSFFLRKYPFTLKAVFTCGKDRSLRRIVRASCPCSWFAANSSWLNRARGEEGCKDNVLLILLRKRNLCVRIIYRFPQSSVWDSIIYHHLVSYPIWWSLLFIFVSLYATEKYSAAMY